MSDFPTRRMERALRCVIAERHSQWRKWGDQAHLSDDTWALIEAEEFGEACKAILKDNPGNMREEVVQVAAVAVAWLEAIDSRERLEVLVDADGYEDNYE